MPGSGLARRLKRRFYEDRPDWVDGTARYVSLLRRFVPPGARVLDVGPGRGESFNHAACLERCTIVGIDPDPGVVRNPALEEGVVGRVEAMPFPAASFDAVVSNYALEHIRHPRRAAREICRVLKPGGRFVFRTPNLWHYVTLLSRALPERWHGALARWAKGKDGPGGAFRTAYRCNTPRAIREAFCGAGLEVVVLEMVEPEPSYVQFSALFFLLGVAYERVVNSRPELAGLRANILGVLERPAARARQPGRRPPGGW